MLSVRDDFGRYRDKGGNGRKLFYFHARPPEQQRKETAGRSEHRFHHRPGYSQGYFIPQSARSASITEQSSSDFLKPCTSDSVLPERMLSVAWTSSYS